MTEDCEDKSDEAQCSKYTHFMANLFPKFKVWQIDVTTAAAFCPITANKCQLYLFINNFKCMHVLPFCGISLIIWQFYENCQSYLLQQYQQASFIKTLSSNLAFKAVVMSLEFLSFHKFNEA